MEDIVKKAEEVESLSASFVKRISAFEGQISERETRALENARRYSRTSPHADPATRQVVEHNARENARQEVRAFRRDLREGTDTERFDRLRKLTEFDSEVSKLAPHFESPVQLLSRAGLGSRERTEYVNQLRHAGTRELENYARWAMTKGDRILAAAVLSRLDAMPAKKRPISAQKLAESLVGEEFEQAQAAFRKIRLAVQRAVNVNRDFERGRVDTHAKIARGLAARQ